MKKSLLRYLSALLLFGSNGIVAAQMLLPSTQIVLVRTFLGSLLLVAILGAGLLRSHEGLQSTEHPMQALFLALSGAALGGGWIFLFQAYRLIGVGISSLTYYTGPVIVMALSPLLFHTHLGTCKLAGFAAVVAGCFLVVGQGLGGTLSPLGLACGFMSAVMYALMVIFSKKVTDICGLENATVQLIGSFACVFIYALLTGQALPAFAATDIAPALMIGFVNTGLGCFLYFSAMHDLPVQTVSVCGYLEPLSAVVFSVILLHEPMSAAQVAGAALILGGAAFCELSGKARKEPKRAEKVTQGVPSASLSQAR
ncbi:MAG: DMT family transporter [Atopobiaceae bacterium]